MVIQMNPLHHPKPHARSFPQAHEIRQGDVGLEVQREGQYLSFFEGQHFESFEFGDFHLDLFVHGPADAFGEGEDIAGEDGFQQLELLGVVAFQF